MQIQLLQQAMQAVTVSPESKLSNVSKDATLLQNAIRAPKIELLSYDDTKGLIKKAMLMVGLKVGEIVATSDIEKQIMVDFLKRNFETLTTEEFVLAFEMAILGKLECDATCYNNFSISYLSKILSAYRLWANKTYNDNRQMIENYAVIKLAPPKKDWKEYCELTYQQFLTGSYNTDTWAIDEMYKEFESSKYISQNLYEDYEADAECQFLKKLENKLFDAKLYRDVNEAKKIEVILKEINESDVSHVLVINQAKQNCIIDFFNYCKDMAKLKFIYEPVT